MGDLKRTRWLIGGEYGAVILCAEPPSFDMHVSEMFVHPGPRIREDIGNILINCHKGLEHGNEVMPDSRGMNECGNGSGCGVAARIHIRVGKTHYGIGLLNQRW